MSTRAIQICSFVPDKVVLVDGRPDPINAGGTEGTQTHGRMWHCPATTTAKYLKPTQTLGVVHSSSSSSSRPVFCRPPAACRCSGRRTNDSIRRFYLAPCMLPLKPKRNRCFWLRRLPLPLKSIEISPRLTSPSRRHPSEVSESAALGRFRCMIQTPRQSLACFGH